MNTISSGEFRKNYAKLTEPTIVTVNQHPIGTWLPNGEWTVRDGQYTVRGKSFTLADRDGPQRVRETVVRELERLERPFTPAPKPSQKTARSGK